MELNKKKITLPGNRRSIWPYLIVGLLAAHVAGMAVAVTITLHDKTFLVVPDYYDKAQHWDAAQAEKRASASLGWKIQIEVSPVVDEHGNRAARFFITGADDRALPDANVEVEYFHHAHPDQQHKTSLTADPSDARAFISMLAMPYTGVWEFHFTVQSVGKAFTQTQTPYVVSQRPADAAGK